MHQYAVVVDPLGTSQEYPAVFREAACPDGDTVRADYQLIRELENRIEVDPLIRARHSTASS